MNAKDSLQQNHVHLGTLNRTLPKLYHGLYIVVNEREYQAGSVVGYAFESGEDPYKAVLRSEKNNHTESRLWINACSICITSSVAIQRRDAERYNKALKLRIGDLAIFEGNVVRLVSAPNQNIGLDYLSKDEIFDLQKV